MVSKTIAAAIVCCALGVTGVEARERRLLSSGLRAVAAQAAAESPERPAGQQPPIEPTDSRHSVRATTAPRSCAKRVIAGAAIGSGSGLGFGLGLLAATGGSDSTGKVLAGTTMWGGLIGLAVGLIACKT